MRQKDIASVRASCYSHSGFSLCWRRGSLALGPREDKSRRAFATAPAAESTMKDLVILYFQSDSGDEKRERRKPTGLQWMNT